MIDGRPFPWPERLDDAERDEANLDLLRRTLAFVSREEGDLERMRTVLGFRLPHDDPSRGDRSERLRIDDGLAAIAAVAAGILTLLEDGTVTRDEAAVILRQTEDALNTLSRIRTLAGNSAKRR